MSTRAYEVLHAQMAGRATGRVTKEERSLMVQMRAAGKTLEQIALALGRSHGAVGQWLKAIGTMAEARKILEDAAPEAAEAWTDAMSIAARKGDHRAAKDLLTSVGVVADSSLSGPQVVVVGMGQTVTGPDPWAPSAGAPKAPKDYGPSDVMAEMRALAAEPDDPEEPV